MNTTTLRLAFGDGQHADVTYSDYQGTKPYLLLHGGGGPATVAGFAALLADKKQARVIVPTHPGFQGTPRPEALASVGALARLYLDLLASLDLRDVTVVGNSMGGWIAAEMALANNGRLGAIVLVNAVGVVVPEHPVADVSKLTPPELAKLSFHNPELMKPPPGAPSGPSPNIPALLAYAGLKMNDPTLLDRLAKITLPTQILWGESDRVVTPDYGRAFARAIPNARFTLLPEAGHLPQIEAPQRLLEAIG